jgi:hypothetical protein
LPIVYADESTKAGSRGGRCRSRRNCRRPRSRLPPPVSQACFAEAGFTSGTLVGAAAATRLSSSSVARCRVCQSSGVPVSTSLAASAQIDPPRAVDPADVSGAQPSFDERALGLDRIVPVAPGDRLAPDEDLAHAGRLVAIQQRDVDARTWIADRIGVVTAVLVGQHRRQRARLGHPESVPDPRVRHRLLQAGHELGGDRGAAVQRPADTGHRRGAEVRRGQDVEVDRRDRDHQRDAFGGDRLHHLCRVEAVEDHECSSGQQRRHHLRGESGHVEERDAHERSQVAACVRRDPRGTPHVLSHPEQGFVCGGGAFAAPGCAAGVEDGGEISRPGAVVQVRGSAGSRRARVDDQRHRGAREDLRPLGRGQTGVDGHHDCPAHQDADAGDDPVETVGEIDRDAVPGFDPRGVQATGYRAAALPQLGVRQSPARNLHHRFDVRCCADDVVERFHHRRGEGRIVRGVAGRPPDRPGVERAVAAAPYRHDP